MKNMPSPISGRTKTLGIVTSLIAVFAAQQVVPVHAGVLMEGFYANVPSGNGSAWWWDNLASNANAMRLAGFTAVWLPPVAKGASGSVSNGYDPFDDYDLGSKNQKGTIPTRYGTRQQLERCCAIMHANGLQIYSDVVDNHRNGDDGNFGFQYADAYGNATGGRFAKGFNDFHPNVAQDPDIPDGNSEYYFGRDLAPVNGAKTVIGGQTWVWVDYGLKQALDWETKALDLNGYRLDYARGISWDWLYSLLNYGSMAGKYAMAENTDTSAANLNTWVATNMKNRSSALDFPLHSFYILPMCNTPASFNMGTLDHAGLTGLNPGGSVTFVENHDSDGSGPITQNKLLGYAYILTSDGYPCVFYRDWSTQTGCYGSTVQGATTLQAGINNLIWIHEKIATGTTQQRYKSTQIFAYERMSGNHLLTGLSSDSASAHTITCATGFGANRQLHDYSGHSPDVVTDASGNVTITIPKNTAGTGYVCYSVTGITGSFTASQNSTTQEYWGAQDLDIKPADPTGFVTACTVNVASGKLITGALSFDTTSWTASTTITLQLVGPTGAVLGTQTYTSTTAQGTALSATAASTGNYTYNIRSTNTPAANPRPSYWLKTTYTAPQF